MPSCTFSRYVFYQRHPCSKSWMSTGQNIAIQWRSGNVLAMRRTRLGRGPMKESKCGNHDSEVRSVALGAGTRRGNVHTGQRRTTQCKVYHQGHLWLAQDLLRQLLTRLPQPPRKQSIPRVLTRSRKLPVRHQIRARKLPRWLPHTRRGRSEQRRRCAVQRGHCQPRDGETH